MQQTHFDSATEGFFLRELEFIESNVLRDEYPEYQAASGKIVPLEIKNMPHIRLTTYRKLTRVGMFRLVQDYVTTIPMVEILSEEKSLPVHAKGAGFYYSDDEILAAQATNFPLEQEKVATVREAAEQDLDEWIFFGIPKIGHYGLVNHPDVLYSLAPYPINATTPISSTLALINDAINASPNLTNGVEKPNTMLWPRALFQFVNTAIIPDTGGKTILDFVKERHPEVEMFIVDRLKGAASSGNDLIITYKRDPSKLKAMVMQPLTFFPPERRGFGYQIPAKYRYGGLRVYREMSINVMEVPAL